MPKPIKIAGAVDAFRLRFAAEAEEGKRKNDEARVRGEAPEKIACPFAMARGGKCPASCGRCGGRSWIWSDGQPAKLCPTSGQPCARPWCWACRNGNRPPDEIKRLRVIFSRIPRTLPTA